MDIQLGTSVVVKPNTKDPDWGFDIGGWQGRVTKIVAAEDTISIAWDSLTLQAMPDSLIQQCEVEGLDWQQMYLSSSSVELTTPRDIEDDVKTTVEQIRKKHVWDSLGKDGRVIKKLLAHIDPTDQEAIFQTWQKHLHKSLSFPFAATITDNFPPFRFGDRVMAQRLVGYDTTDGILAEVRVKQTRDVLIVPLWILQTTDKKNAKHLDPYSLWYVKFLG